MLIKNVLPAGWAAGALALSCISLFHTFGTETALAAPSFLAPGYRGTVYHQDSGSDPIVSYDWGSDGALYYSTALNGYQFGGLYRTESGSTTVITPADTGYYSANAVVASGDFIYFNNENNDEQYIYGYGPLGISPAVNQIATATNYTLATHGGNLFISGAPGFVANEIYYSPLTLEGGLAAAPISLGVTGGNSGPMTFDAEGNMYYAPGFTDKSIYRWSAAELAAAMADPDAAPLSLDGNLWLNYGSLGDYGTVSGATSMIIGADGNLWVTLSNFDDPSVLASFGLDELGAYSGLATNILSDTGRLGELREQDGAYYVSAGNAVYLITVPEPGAGALLILAIAGSFLIRSRRRRFA